MGRGWAAAGTSECSRSLCLSTQGSGGACGRPRPLGWGRKAELGCGILGPPEEVLGGHSSYGSRDSEEWPLLNAVLGVLVKPARGGRERLGAGGNHGLGEHPW